MARTIEKEHIKYKRFEATIVRIYEPCKERQVQALEILHKADIKGR